MTDQTEDRSIVHTFADYMAECEKDGVSKADAYRSYRHAYRCELNNWSWDYGWRVRAKGIKCNKRQYIDASYATEATAT